MNAIARGEMEKRKSLGCESQIERFCPVVSTSCGLMSLDLQEVAQRESFFDQVVQGVTPYENRYGTSAPRSGAGGWPNARALVARAPGQTRAATGWTGVDGGFNVRTEIFRPMLLLKPGRLVQDEGLRGSLRFDWNLLRDAEARRRVIAMRRVFAKYRRHLSAIMLVGIKRRESARNNAHPKEEFGHNDGAPFEQASKLEMSWRRASFF